MQQARRVELARLPDAVAELIATLAPGGSLVLTQGGEPVATLTAAGSAPLEGTVVPGSGGPNPNPNPDSDSRGGDGDGPGDGDGDESVTVVATTMKLSDSARTKLSAELGADYIVLDMHAAPRTADVLLVPPISPQLLRNLRSMFPSARVVVAEIDDPELGVSYYGPVRRLLDSGAELYLSSTTVPHLARQLGEAVTARGELAAGRARQARPELE